MPKQKTHKGTKKRFRLTAKGKAKHRSAVQVTWLELSPISVGETCVERQFRLLAMRKKSQKHSTVTATNSAVTSRTFLVFP